MMISKHVAHKTLIEFPPESNGLEHRLHNAIRLEAWPPFMFICWFINALAFVWLIYGIVPCDSIDATLADLPLLTNPVGLITVDCGVDALLRLPSPTLLRMVALLALLPFSIFSIENTSTCIFCILTPKDVEGLFANCCDTNAVLTIGCWLLCALIT